MANMLESLMTPQQVIERYGPLLGIKSTKTLWQLRRDGRLGFFRSGKRVLHSPEHIEAYLRTCERSAA